jgi:hypothetical protein
VVNLHTTEAEQTHQELATLRVTHGEVHDTTSVVVTAVWLEPVLLQDHLRALPSRVWAAAAAGCTKG